MSFRKTAVFVIYLILCLALFMTACHTSINSGDGGEATREDGTTTLEPAITTPLPPYFPVPTGLLTAPEVEFPGYDPLAHQMRDITSWELIDEIVTGWNLGNTFDAPFGETSWQNPKTTYALISAIKDAGFDSVRVPVTWDKHMEAAPGFEISEVFMDRVQQVVDYVLAAGMYCIINTHHESWLLLDEESEPATTAQLIAVWEQISERFKDYNEKLIFEGMNEPRTIGSPREWQGGTAIEHLAVNRLNHTFVETVRNTGGRNALRHLMVVTYAASAENDAVKALARDFPRDDDKIIASIHAYTPHIFALRANGAAVFDTAYDAQDIDWLFARLQTEFVDKGIPVILGETGAVDRRGNLIARVEWTRYYFGKAREMGFPCYWWDNGLFWRDTERDEEYFGLMHRNSATFVFPEIIDAIMNN